nr:hypothetical protein [Desulfococcus multivorans]
MPEVTHIDQVAEFFSISGNGQNPVPGFEILYIHGLGSVIGFTRIFPVVLHITVFHADHFFYEEPVCPFFFADHIRVGMFHGNSKAADAIHITGFSDGLGKQDASEIFFGLRFTDFSGFIPLIAGLNNFDVFLANRP